jgi:hypothetical protein
MPLFLDPMSNFLFCGMPDPGLSPHRAPNDAFITAALGGSLSVTQDDVVEPHWPAT